MPHGGHWEAVTWTEPEWTPTLRAQALAAVRLDRETCNRCGQRMTWVDMTDKVADGTPKSGDKLGPPVVAWPDSGRRVKLRALRCESCAAIDFYTREQGRGDKGETPKGKPARSDGLRIVVEEVVERGNST